MGLYSRATTRAPGADACLAERQQDRASSANSRQRDQATRGQSRAERSLSQTGQEFARRTARASDDVDRCTDAAHHHAASATKPGRASLTNRAAKREDSWLAPAACACAHPETSRAVSQRRCRRCSAASVRDSHAYTGLITARRKHRLI